jgi:hypothetical protein
MRIKENRAYKPSFGDFKHLALISQEFLIQNNISGVKIKE